MKPYDSKFYTKAGRLNRYALACGYIERGESEDNDTFRSVTLEMSGSVLHVNCYKRETRQGEQFSTNKLKDARLVFSQKLREYGLKRKRV